MPEQPSPEQGNRNSFSQVIDSLRIYAGDLLARGLNFMADRVENSTYMASARIKANPADAGRIVTEMLSN